VGVGGIHHSPLMVGRVFSNNNVLKGRRPCGKLNLGTRAKTLSWHSPFTIHHSPIHHSPIHHSQFTIHNSPFTIHHSQFTIHHSPFTIHHSPFTIHHSQFTIHQFTIHQFTIKIGQGGSFRVVIPTLFHLEKQIHHKMRKIAIAIIIL
jgi:hypothetical protein